jgi:hypothetical protein
MSRLGSLTLVVLVLGGFALYVFETQPRWYERLRYPLRYEQIVTGHADNYHLDPQLVAAVIYQESKFDAHAVSSSGAVGLMQLLPETAQGISAICSTNTATRSLRSPRTTPARPTSTAGARKGGGSSSPRLATTSTACRS